MKIEYKYSVRRIECLNYDGEWIENDYLEIGSMWTSAKNVGDALRRWLKKNGIAFKPYSTCVADYDYSVEIVDRKTLEPLFSATLQEV